MAITLPTGKLAPTRLNPKILVLYGIPKCGKTEVLTLLGDDVLITDTEGGAEMYDCQRVRITKSQDIDDTCKAISDRALAAAAVGGDPKNIDPKKIVFPYKFIGLDTIDKLEDMVDAEESEKLRRKTMNEPPDKRFTGKTVTDLAYGAGYGLIREGVKEKIDMLSRVCKHLVIISHVKDKFLEEKQGMAVIEKELSLSGKLGAIIAAKADAIGYVFRNPAGQLMVSFNATGNTVRGARFKHLANQVFEFDWNKIFIPENVSAPTAETA